MKPIFAHKEKLFAGITFPQKVWNLEAEGLIGISHYVSSRDKDRRGENMLFLYHKDDLYNARYTCRCGYLIEHILHLVDQKAMLISTGQYDGGLSYEGELILWSYLEGEITVQQKGRHFLSCEYTDYSRIKTNVMPQDDQEAEEGYAEIHSYLLPHPLQAFQFVQDLDLLSRQLIKLNYPNRYEESNKAVNQMRLLANSPGWRPSGPIMQVVVVKSIVVAAVGNFGLKLFNDRLNLISEKYLGFGHPRDLLKFGDKVLLNYVVSPTQKTGSRLCSQIYLWSYEKSEIELVIEWYQCSVSILENKYLLLYAIDLNVSRGIHEAIVINLEHGEMSGTTIEPRFLFFKNQGVSASAYALHFTSALGVSMVSVSPELVQDTLVEFKPKFDVKYINLGFVIDHLFVFNGVKAASFAWESEYFICVYNIQTKEVRQLCTYKDEYEEIEVIKRGGEYFVFALTKENELDVISIQTGKLSERIDVSNFGVNEAISFVIDDDDLVLGTRYGDVFRMPQYLKAET
ncbi:MAG: hypothetical protein R2792_06670 [Saprospiraceae bacterium]